MAKETSSAANARRSGLTSISISNVGVIGSAEISFSPGFTAITGETGAGKTMLLNSIGAILGDRLSASVIKIGQERATVSATFMIDDELKDSFSEAGFETEGSELQISRSVNLAGRSKYLIEGMLAGGGSELVQELVQVTAQSSTLALAKISKQRELLDRFAGTDLELLPNYQRAFSELTDVSARLKLASNENLAKDAEIAKLEEFAATFNALRPQVGELAEIETEISRLENMSALIDLLRSINSTLEGDEENLGWLDGAARIAQDVAKLAHLDQGQEELAANAQELLEQAKEFGYLIAKYESDLEIDPVRLDELQLRKRELLRFIKRFESLIEINDDSTDAISSYISFANECEVTLHTLSGGPELIAQLVQERDRALAIAADAARALYLARASALAALEKQINLELKNLSMASARVRLLHAEGGYAEGDLTNFGSDTFEIHFAGFVDESGVGRFGPVGKIASGGELSRLMLALELVVASKTPGTTYIFDEIDAGVGGAAALEVGRRLAGLAKYHQVIVVTHLAQVAVWADANFVVAKSGDNSQIKQCQDEALLVEIARLLSGQVDSEVALAHAAELLTLARESRILTGE